MFILWCFGVIFCRNLLGLFDVRCLCLLFVQITYLMDKSGNWNNLLLLGWCLSIPSITIVYILSEPEVGAHVFSMLILSVLIAPLLRIKFPPLCLLISFSLNFILLDHRVTILGCLPVPFIWNSFFHPFTWGDAYL